MLTIINNETDAVYNLALEEYVLKHLNINEDILLVWQNKDSVVIGKDQNPFREVNTLFTHQNKIPIYRRITGGETIFHDQGTINYSFIIRNKAGDNIKYQDQMKPILDALREFGIQPYFEDNGDLCVIDKRFSINTQSLYGNKTIHHGVLFFSTDLEKLNHVLNITRVNEFEYNEMLPNHKEITNIEEFFENKLSMKEFKTLMLKRVVGDDLTSNRYELDYIDKTKIKKIAKEKYATWEWVYGNSPEFIIKKEFENRMMITLIVKSGIIDKVSIDSFESVISLIKGLEGCVFSEEALRENLKECSSFDIDKLIETLLY